MKFAVLNKEPKTVYSGELCLRSRNATIMLEDEEENLDEVFGEFTEQTEEDE